MGEGFSRAPSFHQEILPGLAKGDHPPLHPGLCPQEMSLRIPMAHSQSSHFPSPHLHMAVKPERRLRMPQLLPSPAYSSSGQSFHPGTETKGCPMGRRGPPWQVGHPQPPPSSKYHFHPAPRRP